MPQPPTWPLNPKPIPPPTTAAQPHAVARDSFDCGSAGIGVFAAFAITLAGAVLVRRRLARVRL
jgi:uncharacterized protein (TIGR03382 family)